MRKYFILLSTLVILNGCTTYKPPNKPQSQLAIIQETDPDGIGILDIISINKKSTISLGNDIKEFIYIPNWFKKGFWVPEQNETYALEIGETVLFIRLTEGIMEFTGEIKFQAEANKKYELRSERGRTNGIFLPDYAIFSVVDLETKKIISEPVE